MNYPTTVTNPLLKKHQQVNPASQAVSPNKYGGGALTGADTYNQDFLSQSMGIPNVKFSNHERPVSCPQ